MNTLDFVDQASLRDDIPAFGPGDTVNVHVKVIEGSKERIQVFKGVVLRRQGGGVRETFTVRKESYGVGVERTFPVHSPNVDHIEVVTRGVKLPDGHYSIDVDTQDGDAVTAIVAGDVAGAFVSTALGAAQVKGGKMRGLAITSSQRSLLLPDVPTVAEAGLPKLNLSAWLGVLAPAGTPPAVLDLLNRRFVEAVQTPEVRQKLVEAGFTVTGTSRSDTDRMLKAEAARWSALVKSTGFRGD